MIREVKAYSVHCDWPGCDHQFESYEFSIFINPEDYLEDMVDLMSPDRTEHYCRDHPAVWASDHENGEPYPDPPYLLIHDGDTDDDGDNGAVKLVTA